MARSVEKWPFKINIIALNQVSNKINEFLIHRSGAKSINKILASGLFGDIHFTIFHHAAWAEAAFQAVGVRTFRRLWQRKVCTSLRARRSAGMIRESVVTHCC